MRKLWVIIAGIIAGIGVMRMEANEIGLGERLPPVTATDHRGRVVELGDGKPSGIVLVFFYPKADTPGCTAQACSLRDSFEELQSRGVLVWGVSYDAVVDQSAFREKYQLPYDLLADEDRAVSNAFGRPDHRRQAFLLEDGVVIWRDLQASTDNQARDVKQALMDLGRLDFPSMR